MSDLTSQNLSARDDYTHSDSARNDSAHTHTDIPPNWKRLLIALLGGQAVSTITSGAAGWAVIWYLTVTTGDPLILSLASVAYFLPPALLGPFIGPLIDRFDRRMIMIVSDLFTALVMALLALAVFFKVSSVPLIFVALVLRSVGVAFHDPALQAAAPLLVPPKHLGRVGAITQSIIGVSYIGAPALGIFVYTTFGLHTGVALDVVGATVACLILAFIKLPEVPAARRSSQHFWLEFRRGLRTIRLTRGLLLFIIIIAAGNFFYFPVASLAPLMTAQHFGGTGYQAALVEAIFGTSFFVASLLVGVWGGGKKLVRAVFLGVIGTGAFFAIGGLLPRTGFRLFLVAIAGMGIAESLYAGLINPIIQHNVAPQELGRVMTVYTSLASITAPAGLLVAGVLAERTGVPAILVISGVALVMLGAGALAIPQLRPLNHQMASLDEAIEAAQSMQAQPPGA
ncbi:MAG: MFS transporter [Coriobacteriia bacterium]|nr:MFS transporter [Coriobacteriia bacterium]